MIWALHKYQCMVCTALCPVGKGFAGKLRQTMTVIRPNHC